MAQSLDDSQTQSVHNPSGPRKVNKLTVHIDRDLCIGAATCLAVAPKVFALDKEAKAIILETAGEATDEMIIDAARACPTAAITVTDEAGNKIFP